MSFESVFPFSVTGYRFNDFVLRHFAKQRSTSGRFQAKDFLNIRSAENRLTAKFLQQFTNMRIFSSSQAPLLSISWATNLEKNTTLSFILMDEIEKINPGFT